MEDFMRSSRGLFTAKAEGLELMATILNGILLLHGDPS